MTTTLPNGTRVPDVASTSWAGDLEVNWQLLDAAIGAIGSNVQTNRPNTWTAEQTFSEPIIGNLTGTASKAGADEDGTSIKTGYVNVAGNQTVSGQKTWTGEQTFSQTIQGNAATASAFDTAKSITLTGAVTGTVSGTNSWEITTALKTGSAATGGTVTNPYFKIAAWEVAPNDYFGTILQIQNKYYPYQIATLTIGLRTKTDATFQRGYSLLNNAIGIQSSAFILCYKEVTGKVLCELYYYTTTSFNGIRFSVISEGTRNDSSVFNTMVVYQNPAGIAALPSDYTVIQTTIGTYTQDFIPYSTNTYSLGSSSYQWSSVYAQSYYYNGTAWGLDKANVWTGANTFSKDNLGTQTVYTLGTPPQAEDAQALLSGRTTDNNFVTGIYFYQSPTMGTGLRLTIRNKWDSNGYSTTGTTRNAHFEFMQGADKTAYIQWQGYVDNGLYPLANNTYDLGTSTNKWKTLNGINPGALSLPDCSVYTNIDRTDWVYDGGITQNLIKLNSADTVITSNGWLYIRINDTVAGDYFGIRLGGSTEYNPTSIFGESGIGHIDAFVPVVQGFTARFFSTKSPTYFKFYPCLGNV